MDSTHVPFMASDLSDSAGSRRELVVFSHELPLRASAFGNTASSIDTSAWASMTLTSTTADKQKSRILTVLTTYSVLLDLKFGFQRGYSSRWWWWRWSQWRWRRWRRWWWWQLRWLWWRWWCTVRIQSTMTLWEANKGDSFSCLTTVPPQFFSRQHLNRIVNEVLYKCFERLS